MIHAFSNHPRGILLGIAVRILEDAIPDAHRQRRDVAGRRDGLDSLIQRCDEGGLKPAAARAGDADARAIDLGPRQQVIERANAVPDLPPRQVGAGEIGKVSEDRVLAANQVVAASSARRIPELAAFALPDRIPTDHDVAAQRKPLTQCMVVRLAVRGVAAGDEHCRTGPLAAVGHVDERRDVDTGNALENQLLDAKPGHLHSAGHLRVEWRARRWQTTDHPQQLRPQL